MFQDLLVNELSIKQIERISDIEIGSASTKALKGPLENLKVVLERADMAENFITPSILTLVNNAISQMKTQMAELLNADLGNTGNPSQFLSQKVEQITVRAFEIIGALLPVAAMSIEFNPTKFADYENAVKRSVDQIESMKEQAVALVESNAVSAAWEYFESQASNHAAKSLKFGRFLALGVLIAIATILAYFWGFVDLRDPNINLAAELFPIINLLALFWFVINTLNRNLRAHQHQHSLNENKAIIMRSGLVLMERYDEHEERSDIRATMVQTCFGYSETGFLRNETQGYQLGNSGLLGLIKQISSR